MARAFLIVALAALVGYGPAAAQTPEDPAGAATDAVPADGLFTKAQARRGRDTFRQVCAACHSQTEFHGGAFEFMWEGRTVLSLFEQLRSTMPWDDPGGLEPETYVDVIAYLLELNDFPAGDRPLPAEEEVLGSLRIERPPEGPGPGPDPTPGGGGE